MRNKRGITLIALIITIIVLLILAGVSINALVGDNRDYFKCAKSEDCDRRSRAQRTDRCDIV